MAKILLGLGINAKTAEELLELGVDGITSEIIPGDNVNGLVRLFTETNLSSY